MKLTSKSEYALLALIFLSRNYEDGYFSSEAIAEAQNIPHKYLEQILTSLKRARIVVSVKGKNGGYKLAKNPEQIFLAEIIRLFDGALAPTNSVSTYFYEETPIRKEEKILAVFQEVRDYIADKMENTSLADIS
jgi:Rrf2 family protein